MINFYDLEFKRIIAHQILGKKEGMEHASVVPDENLFEITENVKNLLIERLAKSINQNSKAFELEIANYTENSFFGHVFEMYKYTDSEFIKHSVDIAELLAASMTKSTLPGGYFIMIEADTSAGKPVYIAMKAELHEALRYEVHDRRSMLRHFDDVFLSPTNKLYKFGVIYEREEHIDFLPSPNNRFGCFLYDNQFRVDSKPAEYFYFDFLGFSTYNNAKIQSKRFYEHTENFVNNYVPEFDKKENIFGALKQEFLNNEEPDVKPLDFAGLYLHDDDVRDAYVNEVANYLPKSVAKDPTMIKSSLEKKKLTFPNQINLTGPNNTFEYSVKIIKSKSDLEELDFENDEFTLIKISGKPYQE